VGAGALALDPKLAHADEPTGNLVAPRVASFTICVFLELIGVWRHDPHVTHCPAFAARTPCSVRMRDESAGFDNAGHDQLVNAALNRRLTPTEPSRPGLHSSHLVRRLRVGSGAALSSKLSHDLTRAGRAILPAGRKLAACECGCVAPRVVGTDQRTPTYRNASHH